jgi:hypothetical protein
VARPRQQKHRKKRTILGEGRRNAGINRYRQLETPLQKLTHNSGNNTRKKKKTAHRGLPPSLGQGGLGLTPTHQKNQLVIKCSVQPQTWTDFLAQYVDMIHLAQKRDWWWQLVDTIMNLLVLPPQSYLLTWK